MKALVIALSLAALSSIATLVPASAALAQENANVATDTAATTPPSPTDVAEEPPPHAPSHVLVGVGGTGLITTAFADSLEINGALGGGLFAEWTAVPEWLAIELDVRLVAAHEGTEFVLEMPIDLLLKKPIELSEKLEIYFGIGGTLVPVFASPDTKVLGGIASVVGGYYWLTRHVALVGELDYNLLFGGAYVVQEVGGSFGIALGV